MSTSIPESSAWVTAKTGSARGRAINNEMYEVQASRWWDDETPFGTLRRSVIPVRMSFCKKHLEIAQGGGSTGRRALEVGCGGGLFTEEIAGMGFVTTGIDPSEASLTTAREHADSQGLTIRYDKGVGEALPYADHSFDVVFCCDVLEHVKDPSKVVAEVSRVLRPGGSFIFDTFNRTFVSKLIAIKFWQEWKRWAFMEPNTHVWSMFIKPSELEVLLRSQGMEVRDWSGTAPSVPIPALLSNMRKRAKGSMTFREFSDSFHLVEASDMNLMYLGYAVKPQEVMAKAA